VEELSADFITFPIKDLFTILASSSSYDRKTNGLLYILNGPIHPKLNCAI
jgi:hypothetical protein